MSSFAGNFIVHGVIADNGSNAVMVGRTTYLVRASDWFAWDGDRPDHAARFLDEEAALAAATSCTGPLFRLPDPDTVSVIELHSG